MDGGNVDVCDRDIGLGYYWEDGTGCAVGVVEGLVVYDYSWSLWGWNGRHCKCWKDGMRLQTRLDDRGDGNRNIDDDDDNNNNNNTTSRFISIPTFHLYLATMLSSLRVYFKLQMNLLGK